MLTGARMNISREHFATAGGENLFCSRDANGAMSRKISLLREVERGGVVTPKVRGRNAQTKFFIVTLYGASKLPPLLADFDS